MLSSSYLALIPYRLRNMYYYNRGNGPIPIDPMNGSNNNRYPIIGPSQIRQINSTQRKLGVLLWMRPIKMEQA